MEGKALYMHFPYPFLPATVWHKISVNLYGGPDSQPITSSTALRIFHQMFVGQPKRFTVGGGFEVPIIRVENGYGGGV